MARNAYIRNAVPQGMREQAGLLRQSKKKLSKFDRTLNEDDLGELLKSLNAIGEILKGRKPGEDEEVDNSDSPFAEDLEDDEGKEVKGDGAKEIAKNMRYRANAVAEELSRKPRHVTNASRGHSREMSSIRNALIGSASSLTDEELAEIAARNERTRKHR